MSLTAQMRRKLNHKLRGVKCPRCRAKVLGFLVKPQAITCGCCGGTSQPADHGLTWHPGDARHSSYWTE